ncbi:hypothetical protein OF83DRAFT_1176666 [Amylostereum chailletii]|nr:hypothetical protein OF83DRAFT_1176666 [Amylostereum chailletii]
MDLVDVLPTELQIYIFELATDVPHLFDIAPDPADLILPEEDIETLLEVF